MIHQYLEILVPLELILFEVLQAVCVQSTVDNLYYWFVGSLVVQLVRFACHHYSEAYESAELL